MDDVALLREYAHTGSETAFATLVERHLGLVYSAAKRQLCDPQLAEDVTQNVFVLLARKAGKLSRHPGLSGWLLKTTRYVANAHIRATQRRIHREKEAAMQSERSDSSPAIWAQLEPHLDEAMASLGTTDRAVLALRYFENKTAAEIGQALKLSEEAARKRANRALEKLRKFFGKKGIALSAGAIAAAVAANSVQAAPVGLAAKITRSVLAKVLASASTTAFFSTMLGKALAVSGPLCLAIVGAVLLLHLPAKNPPSVPLRASSPGRNKPRLASAQSGDDNSVASPVAAQNDKLQAAMDHLRRVLHTRPTTSEDFDSRGITNAIDEFGNYRADAFNVLLENANDPESFVVRGSIYGMGYVGKYLPQAPSVLWDILGTREEREHWSAFYALKNIGFGASDLPALIDLVTNGEDSTGGALVLNREVPQSIAGILNEYPKSATLYVPVLERLLGDRSSAVQLRAALALIKLEGATNPGVFPPLHAMFSLTNDWANQYLKSLTTPILGNAGRAAKPLIPDLLKFASNATEPIIQADARGAVARIDPAMAWQDPRVAVALQKQVNARAWADLWKSKSYTFDDLRAALHDPEQAHTAAGLLAAMGTNASPAVPEMLRAIWGMDEDTRNEMVDCIHKIDPHVTIHKMDLSTMIIPGNVFDFLDKQPATDENKALKESLTNVGGFYGWMLPEEWDAFTNKMAMSNPAVYRIFVSTLIQTGTAKIIPAKPLNF